jgi:hypothetical protein
MLQSAKEQIRLAITKSKIVIDYDEKGKPILKTVTKEEAVKEVLDIFDHVAYHFLELNAGGLALERLIYDIVPDLDMKAYMNKYVAYAEEERLKNTEYHYENDEFEEPRVTDSEREERKKMFSIIDGGKKD